MMSQSYKDVTPTEPLLNELTPQLQAEGS
jgi:hypothetical protein